MTKSFSLADLIPSPLTFEDTAFGGDGAIHTVKTWDLFSSEDIATLMRFHNDIGVAFAANDAAKAERLINQLLSMLIPTLPQERLKAIPVTFKGKFLEWWEAEQPKPEQSPKSKRAASSRGKKPAPSSPTPAPRTT